MAIATVLSFKSALAGIALAASALTSLAPVASASSAASHPTAAPSVRSACIGDSVAGTNVNVRNGHGTQYAVKGKAQSGWYLEMTNGCSPVRGTAYVCNGKSANAWSFGRVSRTGKHSDPSGVIGWIADCFLVRGAKTI